MKVRQALSLMPLALTAPAYAEALAPVSALVEKVNIPYEQFTLANGLRVVVHTDRKAPVVAVSVWYHIGSKDEPKGKTGFAHLFEHLMFNGSENAPEDFFTPLQRIGGTDYNGTTSFDRTNYFETVPTAGLETALFLESDRMGHLLGGIDQSKLDIQRGVVQNEKRQGDNQPGGLANYYQFRGLFPAGHPYQHLTIGSMADLNGASLEDVKNWFRANYGPNNAVLVLAGDIDVATAKTLVDKWFGKIPRGPDVKRIAAPISTLKAPATITLTDRVPYTTIAKAWVVEGVNGKDKAALDVAMTVFGGLSSSRLDNALVRSEQSAVGVRAYVQSFESVGTLNVEVDVKPGQDAAAVEKRLDALIADYLKVGPTADEVRRVVTRSAAGTIGGFESVGGFGGKAVALAEGLTYSNDPSKYKKDLTELAAVTPVAARDAARKWMMRPALTLILKNGPRDTSAAALAITGDAGATKVVPGKPAEPAVADMSKFPPLGTFPPLTFPAIERATLANGIKVYLARRTSIPVVRVAVSFDAGSAADPKGLPGLQSLTMALLDEGTTTKNSTQIAEAQERLGASVSSSGGTDRSTVGLYAMTPNLAPSLDLLADVVRNSAFDPKEVERLRGSQLASIAEQQSDPSGIASTILPGKLYGADHPYGRPFSGLGSVQSVGKITRDDIVRFRADWLQPSKAQIYIVGDTTMDEIKPLLEARFGNWAENRMARPVKDFSAAIPASAGNRIYLVDRPNSPQSLIYGGQVLGVTGKDESLITLGQANDVLGSGLLSRLDSDLRETKGWSYGVRSGIRSFEDRAAFTVRAPVQTDRTGDSLAAILAVMKTYLGASGTTPAEFDRVISSSIRELPGDFETSDAVLAAVARIVQFGRPDNFYEQLAGRYGAMTAKDIDGAARTALDPSKFVFVVVGDAKTVRPQLEKLGIPIETVALPAGQ